MNESLHLIRCQWYIILLSSELQNYSYNLKDIPKFKHLNLYEKAVMNTVWAEWLQIKVCNNILCNDINWIFISHQVQGLNIPLRRGTMADIHESESSSLNESSSTSQGLEQDERRYGWLYFLNWQGVFKVPYSMIR
jgi:hypothetical protein